MLHTLRIVSPYKIYSLSKIGEKKVVKVPDLGLASNVIVLTRYRILVHHVKATSTSAPLSNFEDTFP